MHSPRPNHSITIGGNAPHTLPYANPTTTLGIHSALTSDTPIANTWEIMKAEDTIHRQYARGRRRYVCVKSEMRPAGHAK